MYVHSFGNINDELDIGIIIVICASRDLSVIISKRNYIY